MPTAPVSLVCDFLEWLAARPRSYAEVMEAWGTSCPRLTVWEDALEARLIRRIPAATAVELTALGREFLARERPDAVESAAAR